MQNYPPINGSFQAQVEERHLQSKSQNMFTQMYECRCQQIFSTLADYQDHIMNENHEQILSNVFEFKISSNKNSVKKEQRQNQTMKISNNFGYSFNPIEHQNSLPIGENIYQNQLPQNSNNFQFRIPEQNTPLTALQNQTIGKLNRQDYDKMQQQDKQLSMNYVEAYYKSKLDPFYRELDIDSEKCQHNDKLPNKYYQFQEMAMMRQINSRKVIKDNSSKDMDKILSQLNVRMIPVQNGIIQFIGIFIKDHYQLISKVTQEQVELIPIILENSLNELTALCQLKRFNQFNNHQEFMDSDLDLAISMFIDFLKQSLRLNQIWVAYSMLIILVDSVKKFYIIHQNQTYQNLKIRDIPLLFTQIKFSPQNIHQSIPLKIQPQTTYQFLSWFCQWFTMIQYIKNKWNLDFVEPFLDNVHQINYIYQENVEMYRKCVYSRRQQIARKNKKTKIIQTKRKRQKLTQMQKLKNNNLYNGDIRYRIGDNNIQSNKETQKQFAYRHSHRATKQTNSTYKPRTQNQQTNEFLKQDSVTYRMPQSMNSYKGYPQTSSGNNIYRNSTLMNYPSHISKQKRNSDQIGHDKIQDSQQNSHLASQRQNQIDDYDSKQLYLPVFQSQYVCYFSPESEQTRKKQKQLWNIKLQKLKQIVANPIQYKLTLKQEILKQLQQVEQISDLSHLDLGMLNIYGREITHMCKNQFNSRNIQSRINPNPDVVVSPSSERENLKPINKNYDDPFIIKRNYRIKKSDNCLLNSDNPEKIPKQSLEGYHEISQNKNKKRFNSLNERPLSNDQFEEFF